MRLRPLQPPHSKRTRVRRGGGCSGRRGRAGRGIGCVVESGVPGGGTRGLVSDLRPRRNGRRRCEVDGGDRRMARTRRRVLCRHVRSHGRGGPRSRPCGRARLRAANRVECAAPPRALACRRLHATFPTDARDGAQSAACVRGPDSRRNGGGTMAPLGRRLRSERGAELVEFALVMPILMLVLAGILDMGFLFKNYEVVTNAAREGARMASLPGWVEDDVKARVRDYLAAGGLNAAVATTTVEQIVLVTDIATGRTKIGRAHV